MVTAIVSVLSGIPVRKEVAMTGEINLRGSVLPIGGLKEKLLAALRGGIKIVLIPEENVKDLMEIPDNVKNGLEIIPVTHVNQVLSVALCEELKAIEWDPEAIEVTNKSQSQPDGSEVDKSIAH
jgi:ATP-dependent Lon protease